MQNSEEAFLRKWAFVVLFLPRFHSCVENKQHSKEGNIRAQRLDGKEHNRPL